MAYKRACALEPGDRIKVRNPSGDARVVRAYESTATRTDIRGQAPSHLPDRHEYPLAWIIVFRFVTGTHNREALHHTFQHPNDKVETP